MISRSGSMKPPNIPLCLAEGFFVFSAFIQNIIQSTNSLNDETFNGEGGIPHMRYFSGIFPGTERGALT